MQGINSIDDVVDEIQQLRDRVDDLEEENEQLQEENERLRDRVDDLEGRLDERAKVEWSSSDEQEIFVESNNGARYPLGRAVKNKVSEVDVEQILDEYELQESTGDAGDDVVDDLLPIQQLARMPEQAARDHFDNPTHRNTYRARNVWKDVTDYAEKRPVGYVLRSGDLQRVLQAQESEDRRIESKTAHRVMDKIVEYSKDVVDKRKRNGEWILVVPTDFQERAKEAASQADAVVS